MKVLFKRFHGIKSISVFLVTALLLSMATFAYAEAPEPPDETAYVDSFNEPGEESGGGATQEPDSEPVEEPGVEAGQVLDGEAVEEPDEVITEVEAPEPAAIKPTALQGDFGINALAADGPTVYILNPGVQGDGKTTFQWEQLLTACSVIRDAGGGTIDFTNVTSPGNQTNINSITYSSFTVRGDGVTEYPVGITCYANLTLDNFSVKVTDGGISMTAYEIDTATITVIGNCKITNTASGHGLTFYKNLVIDGPGTLSVCGISAGISFAGGGSTNDRTLSINTDVTAVNTGETAGVGMFAGGGGAILSMNGTFISTINGTGSLTALGHGGSKSAGIRVDNAYDFTICELPGGLTVEGMGSGILFTNVGNQNLTIDRASDTIIQGVGTSSGITLYKSSGSTTIRNTGSGAVTFQGGAASGNGIYVAYDNQVYTYTLSFSGGLINAIGGGSGSGITAWDYYTAASGVFTLNLNGNTTLNTIGGASGVGISLNWRNVNIIFTDNAPILTITNNGATAEVHSFTAQLAGADWVLTNAAFTSGTMKDANVSVSTAPGVTSIIKRGVETVPEPLYTVTIPETLALTVGGNALTITVSDTANLGGKAVTITFEGTQAKIAEGTDYRYGAQLDPESGGAGLPYELFNADNAPVTSTAANPAGQTLADFTGNGTKTISLYIDESALDTVERGIPYTGYIIFGIKLL